MSAVAWSAFEAVLWDLDGVITDTAALHERAWAALFHEHGFTHADYLTHVDGRPRYDGVRAFLASRQVRPPEGTPQDPPTAETICGIGNRKDQIFSELLSTEGVQAHLDAVAVIARCRALGLAQAVVSSSRNARRVLAAASQGLGTATFGIATIVDGLTAAERGLAGKPAPDMFLHAAQLLGVPMSRCVVVEDAISGVAAAVAAGAGYVIGVDRHNSPNELRSAGADLVVDDLARTLGP